MEFYEADLEWKADWRAWGGCVEKADPHRLNEVRRRRARLPAVRANFAFACTPVPSPIEDDFHLEAARFQLCNLADKQLHRWRVEIKSLIKR